MGPLPSKIHSMVRSRAFGFVALRGFDHPHLPADRTWILGGRLALLKYLLQQGGDKADCNVWIETRTTRVAMYKKNATE